LRATSSLSPASVTCVSLSASICNSCNPATSLSPVSVMRVPLS
jgi:hypothetical protein